MLLTVLAKLPDTTDAETEEVKKLLIKGKVPKSQLIHACAAFIVARRQTEAEIKGLNKTINAYKIPLDFMVTCLKNSDIEAHKLISYLKKTPQTDQIIELINASTKADKKRSASIAAKTRHKKTSAKREEIIAY
jgi:hypothetical protein